MTAPICPWNIETLRLSADLMVRAQFAPLANLVVYHLLAEPQVLVSQRDQCLAIHPI